MNIIKQYAISHDLSIGEVEMVAQYISPLDTEQFERELESIKNSESWWMDMQYMENMDNYMEYLVD